MLIRSLYKRDNKYLTKFNINNLKTDLKELSKERNKVKCSLFEGNSSGFKAKIHLENNNYVFFSVPNDDGWKIKVNGRNIDSIEVNYGLMAIQCEKGSNIITATYNNKGLKIGIIESAIFVIICFALVILKKFVL